MSAHLESNSYGKARVRVSRIVREGDRHGFRELVVHVTLRGDFEAAHTRGDNANVLPTDTMKNTVLAFAHEQLVGTTESFAAALAKHFYSEVPPVAAAEVMVEEVIWERVRTGVREHDHTFIQRQGERMTARATHDGTASDVVSGLSGLVILKTTDSGFAGFLKDEYTTLPETDDRILGTSVTATWTHAPGADHGFAREAVRNALVHTFAEHHSPSVQATLYRMGEAALEAAPDVSSVTLTMPNLHYLPLDLSPFGIEENRDVFLPSREPHGVIEATVVR